MRSGQRKVLLSLFAKPNFRTAMVGWQAIISMMIYPIARNFTSMIGVCESEEEQQKVHLFEVDVDDAAPQRRDMNIYNEAYNAMSETQDCKCQ